MKLTGIRSFWCCIISEHPHLGLPKGRKSLVGVVRGLLAAVHNGFIVSATLRTPLSFEVCFFCLQQSSFD